MSDVFIFLYSFSALQSQFGLFANPENRWSHGQRIAEPISLTTPLIMTPLLDFLDKTKIFRFLLSLNHCLTLKGPLSRFLHLHVSA